MSNSDILAQLGRDIPISENTKLDAECESEQRKIHWSLKYRSGSNAWGQSVLLISITSLFSWLFAILPHTFLCDLILFIDPKMEISNS